MSGRPGSTRSRVVVLAIAALIAPATLVDAVEAQPERSGFAELPVGEWFGNGRAAGVSTTEGGGIAIAVDGNFTTNMEFVVDIDGALNGTWVLDGAAQANFSMAGAAFQDDITVTSAGSMAGNSRQFSLGTAQMNSTHNVIGDVSYTGTSTDPIGPIDLAVSNIYCNDAWGEWIMSWNLELTEQNYTPTFDGDWYAVRQSADFSDREGDLLAQISQLYLDSVNEFNDLVNGQPSDPDVGLVLPADTLWQFVYRLVDLYNAIRNLTPCDRVLIGEERIEGWIYNVTETIALLIYSLLSQYELGADDLTELVNIATATAAMGEGALEPEAAEGLEKLLNEALTDVFNDSSASAAERVTAAATRWQHGWPLK